VHEEEHCSLFIVHFIFVTTQPVCEKQADERKNLV
jgi:hypothetical protein